MSIVLEDEGTKKTENSINRTPKDFKIKKGREGRRKEGRKKGK